MTDIQPLEYIEATAYKERMQLFDKVNELVDAVNTINGDMVYPHYINVGIGSAGAYGTLFTGTKRGIVSGYAGLTVNGVALKVQVLFDLSDPNTLVGLPCSVFAYDNDGTTEFNAIMMNAIVNESNVTVTFYQDKIVGGTITETALTIGSLTNFQIISGV